MEFFAVAIEPPGNVVRDIRRAFFASLGSASPSLGMGMPTAVYLSFHRRAPGAAVSRNKLRQAFLKWAKELIPLVPGEFFFRPAQGKPALLPEHPGSLTPLLKAAAKAEDLGLEALPIGFFLSLGEIFLPSPVTSAGTDGFSFRRADLILLRCLSDSDLASSLSWEIIARIKRPLGLRKPSLPIEP